MPSELEISNPRAMELMREIAKTAVAKKTIEDKDKKMREELLAMCEEYGVESIDNEYVKISRVNGSESVSIDLKKLEKNESELYEELLNDYPKKTVRKPYLRIVAKG